MMKMTDKMTDKEKKMTDKEYFMERARVRAKQGYKLWSENLVTLAISFEKNEKEDEE